LNRHTRERQHGNVIRTPELSPGSATGVVAFTMKLPVESRNAFA
jgi:hypothetical protein